MSRGICGFLGQLAAALYLIANGVLGLQGGRRGAGVFSDILRRMGFSGDMLNFMLVILSIVALVAGIAILLEMFNIELPILSLVMLIVAIAWVVYIVITLFSWITGGFNNFFQELSMLAVNVMVLASLLTASKRFG